MSETFEWPDDPAERAQELVEGVLDELDLDGDVVVDEDDDRILLTIEGEDDYGLLIGKRGQTIDALQLLCYQAAFRGLRERKRVIVDAAGYRARRRETLEGRADRVIVPVQAEYLALEGLVQFLETLGLIRRELNPQLEVSGLLITMHDERTRLAQDVEAELRDHFDGMVFETVIPRSVRVAESPSYGLPVTEHAPSSHGAVAYRALSKELASRG